MRYALWSLVILALAGCGSVDEIWQGTPLTEIRVANSDAHLWEWHEVNISGMGWVTGITAAPAGIAQGEGQMYIRTDVGGAYRYNREGGGGSGAWEQMMDGIPFGYENRWASSVESIAVDPQNGNTVYVAANGVYPVGGEVYKSMDAGRSWTRTGLEGRPGVFMDGNDTEDSKVPAKGSRYNTGERLMVDPLNSDNIYFASRRDGLWRYDGVRWARVRGGLPGSGASPGFTFVAFDPGSGTANLDGRSVSAVLYVGMYGTGVYKSTNGGASFSLMQSEVRKPQVLRGAVNRYGVLLVTYGDCSGSGPGTGVLGAARDVNVLGVRKTGEKTNNDAVTYSGIAINPRDNMFAVLPGSKNLPVFFFDANGIFTHSMSNMDGRQPPYQDTAWAHSERGGAVFDPLQTDMLYAGTGFGVVRTGDVYAGTGLLTWDDHTLGVSELGVYQVKAAPVIGGMDLHLACADMGGFSIPGRDVVPLSRLCEVNTIPAAPEWGIPLTGITGLDYSYHYPRYMAYAGWHEFGGYTDWAFKFGTSIDGGRTWKEISLPDSAKAQYGLAAPETAGRLAVASNDPRNIVWSPVGGILRYSRDMGETWNNGSADLAAGGAVVDGTFGPVAGRRNAILYENSMPYWGATQNLAAGKQDGFFYLLTSQGTKEMNGTTGNAVPQLWRSKNGGENWELVYIGYKGSWGDYHKAKDAQDKISAGGLPFANVRTHPTMAGGLFVCVRPNEVHYDRAQEFFPLWRSRNAHTDSVSFERVNGVDVCIDVSFGAGTAYDTPYIYIFGKANGDTLFGVYVSEDDGETWKLITDEAHQFGQVAGVEGDMRYRGLVYVYTLGRGVVYGQYKSGYEYAADIYSGDWQDTFTE